MKFSRRELIAHLRNILGTAGAYPLLASPLLGQADTATSKDDEHFFIFVELKGGVHHTVTTDYPSIDAINAIESLYPRGVMKFPVGDEHTNFLQGTQLSADQKKHLKDDVVNFQKQVMTASTMLNGYFCALPYDEANKDKYYYQDPKDKNIRLGPAAVRSLSNHATNLSVLRGVFMQGTFHGLANEEIYSGSSERKGSHVAGVLAQLLEEKYGTKPLDNLVLGRASYITTNEGTLKPAVQVPFATIRALAEKSEGNVDLPLSHATAIARAMQREYGLGGTVDSKYGLVSQSDILDQYLASFDDAERAKQNLQKLMNEKNFATTSR